MNTQRKTLETTLPILGIAVGFILVLSKFGVGGIIFYIPAVACLWFLQIKYKIVTKTGQMLASVISHILAFILQIFIVLGPVKTPSSGWVETKKWEEPSESLWGNSRKEKKHYQKSHQLRNWIGAVGVVVAVDMLLGTGSHYIYPQNIVEEDALLQSSGISGENLEKIQEDGLKFTYNPDILHPLEPGSAMLWGINGRTSDTINYSPDTGRKTVNPTTYDYKIAIIGGSSAFGLGQEDSQTIASELSELLSQKGYKAKVDNFGVPAYSTYQAARFIEQSLERGERYDLIVAITGFNDVQIGLTGAKIPATVFDAELATYFSKNPLLFWADRSLVARIVGYNKRGDYPLIARITNVKTPGKEDSQKVVVEAVEYNLRKGSLALWEIQEKYKIPIEYVWAPRKSIVQARNSSESPTLMELRLQSSKNQVIDIMGLENFTDLDLVNLELDCFLDEVHTVNSCSQAQAEFMATNIIEKLERK